MINFRFHLVSLIAVFLSLALGVVVGSTVIDQAIVDGLEAQIERVERNADTAREENAALRSDISNLNDLSEETFPFAIQERLAETPVAVFAVRGANEDGVRRTLEVVRQAGGLAPAVVWIEEAWSLTDSEAAARLRSSVGVERGTLTELRSQAFEGLAQRVAAGGATVEPTPTSAPPQTARQEATANGDVLAALVDGGFLTIDRMGGDEFDVATFPGEGALALLLTDTGAKVSPGIFTPLIRAAADAPLLTLVADLTTPPDDDEEAPDPPIVAVRDDDDLTQRISTLDDATSAAGRIAVVLALEELQSGEVGHYGHGAGAARTIPEPPQG